MFDIYKIFTISINWLTYFIDTRPRERPKLNLLPRTVPREPEVPTKPADGVIDDKPEKPKPVPAEKVFGAAKPVDTAAK